MHFYQVWVASLRYHKAEPLTYASSQRLNPGELVEVAIQNRQALGFIVSKTTKPAFEAKEIIRKIAVSLPEELVELFSWLQRYYPAPSGQIAQLFVPSKLPKKLEIPENNLGSEKQTTLPPLTNEQSTALEILSKHGSGAVLLHGNTGTGKTRIYTELAQKAIDAGKSAIILTPEIGLTPQLEKTLREQFGSLVIVSHSHLSEAKRRDIWLKLASHRQPRVIVGPRSALFLPLSNVGLIVVDEAHDSSYKQEQAPHYQTTRVAAKLAQLHGCLCVYGTATPQVADYYSLQKNNVPIIRLQKPIHAVIKQPKIHIVDRTKKENFQTSWIFSDQLIKEITSAKQNNLTSLVFLNRRGTARIMLCQNCSWQANCPNCDLPLTYHADQHELICHVCSYKQAPPLSCPVCQSTELSLHAAGTKALETELHRLFPSYKIFRADSDSSVEERLDKQYERLLAGKIDIIAGTQMITKGLDLPKLGVVGIPFADSSLYLPDFTSDEQTYQLLSQVIGRVGRTSQPTNVVVQSYQPDQPIIQAAQKRNWDIFYNKQLEERKKFGYPPFTYLLQLTSSKKQEATLRKNGQALAELLHSKWPNVTVLGPTPRFHRKVRNEFQWQIIVKSTERQTLLEIIKILPAGWRHNIDPTTLL